MHEEEGYVWGEGEARSRSRLKINRSVGDKRPLNVG